MTEIIIQNEVLNLISNFKLSLSEVNRKLWLIEDDIRAKESLNLFDNEFIELARSVYKYNDTRAKIKQSINLVLQSELIEEKSYLNFNIKNI